MGYSFKKINKNERKSLVGSTIQIRGPLLQTLERQELHTLGGSQWGRKQGKGEDPCPFSPVGCRGWGVGEVGGEKLNLNKHLALLDSLDSDP